ncbi:hypothetical protein APHAL10511_001565 [Amanita phalloides]|nr:hypothetical protein APHAL10511_001565 [Amanita phalloides]
MTSSPRTPRRSSRNASQHETYRSVHPGSLLPRDSLMDISPTLVGDSSPPVARETSPLSVGVASSQTTVTSMGSTCDLSTRSAVSTRRKPICRTCGTPRKGHKGGRCPIPVTDDDNKSYSSSPENEWRTPAKSSAKPVAETPVSATLTSASARDGRKQPHCRKCGWPMKGHKRPGGVPQCPTGPPMPPDWDHSANLMPTSPGPKPPNKAPSKHNFRAQDTDAGVSAHDSTPKRSSDVGKFSASPGRERMFSPATSRVIQTSVSPSQPAAAPRRCQRDASLALSEQRSSLSQIRPLARASSSPSPRQDQENDRTTSRRNIDSTPALLSGAPLSAHEPDSSDSLRRIFGEPELTVYSARNRHEATRIRNKARELHYFSGVININSQEHSDKNGGDVEGMTKINECNLKDELHSYTKWVLLSKRENIVRKCVDLYEGQFAE